MEISTKYSRQVLYFSPSFVVLLSTFTAFSFFQEDEETKKTEREGERERRKKCRLLFIVFYSFLIITMMIKQRPPHLTQVCVLFISYIAILQVLYALQTVLVSVPFVAIISTVYFLLIQRTRLVSSTGSNSKASSTHERDLHHLLIQQTEEVLQTNLQHFQKVNCFCLTSNVDHADRRLDVDIAELDDHGQ